MKMNSEARALSRKESSDYGEHSYPVNEDSRRLREESQAGTLNLDEHQVLTYAGRLMIGYRRGGNIYSEPENGYLISNDPLTDKK